MTSSAPNRHNGVLFDTNVLSRFAKTECLHLLLQAFSDLHRAQQLYISPAIHHELEAGLQSGITYLRKVLQLVEDGELQIVHPTSADQQFIKSLPSKLAIGEAEAIALSYRLQLVFISHDRKAINYCERTGIASVKFVVLINRLRSTGLLTESDVEALLM